MILYDTYIPEYMSPAMLDDYLARGWYRIGQTMITTDWTIGEQSIYPVFWIRYALSRYNAGHSARKIIAANRHFTIHVTAAEITVENESLYQAYQTGIDFTVATTLKDALLGDSLQSVFSSRMIEVRDRGRLIAAGFFDEGIESVTGILNFFHPDYKKYSPGKFLFLQKINVALQQQKRYFYPGYISNCFTKFDYKLFADKQAVELFVRKQQTWKPFSETNMDLLVDEMINEADASDGNMPRQDQ